MYWDESCPRDHISGQKMIANFFSFSNFTTFSIKANQRAGCLKVLVMQALIQQICLYSIKFYKLFSKGRKKQLPWNFLCCMFLTNSSELFMNWLHLSFIFCIDHMDEIINGALRKHEHKTTIDSSKSCHRFIWIMLYFLHTYYYKQYIDYSVQYTDFVSIVV